MRDFRAEIKRFTRDNKRIAPRTSIDPDPPTRIEFEEKNRYKSRGEILLISETNIQEDW